MRSDPPSSGRAVIVGASLLVALLLAATVVVPILWAAVGAMRATSSGPDASSGSFDAIAQAVALSPSDVRALATTLGYAGVITILATALAWAPARVLARSPSRWLGLCVMPMVLPPYLAYAGWSLLRSPGSMLGDALFRASQIEHLGWVAQAAGRVTAVIGLASWVWPLAALVLAQALRARAAGIDDQLALDGPGRLRGLWHRALVVRGALLGSLVLIFLIMLGSAVPLHVAQTETFALKIWLRLDQSSPEQSALIWLSGWPLWLPALAAAAVAGWWMARPLKGFGVQQGARIYCSPATFGTASAIWALTTIVPLGLFAWELLDDGPTQAVRILQRFIAATDQELASTGVALGVTSVLGVLLAAWAAWVTTTLRSTAARGGTRWLGRLLVAVLCTSVVGALAPGVLVGAALSRFAADLAAAGLGGLGEGPWVMLAAMTARWSIVPLAAGIAMAITEPASITHMRTLDGGNRLGTFLRGWARARWPMLLGVGLLFGLLSIHEIEAAVQVTTPDWPSLPRKLLNLLHFLRDDDLSAAIVLMEVPVLIALITLGLLIRTREDS